MSTHEAIVFDVQRFSVHDGPGIRTTVFFKGCPLRCLWCQNPEGLRAEPEVAFYPERCRAARDCRAACPRDALRPDGGRVVRDRCDGCGRCADACPYEALRVVGRRVTVDALAAHVLRDAPFYAASHGGVTLSGGEPTAQMAFVGELARRCRDAGVGVALQTCGTFRWEAFAPYASQFELVQLDLKVIDADAHRRLTGGDNAVILENARRLRAAAATVQFRTPIVPGMNDDERDLRALAAFLRAIDAPAVQLLRYHAMGEAKRARVGLDAAPLGIDGTRATAALARAADVLEAAGVQVTT